MTDLRTPFPPDERIAYVVVVFDRWDENSISFVLGPYDNLADARASWEQSNEKIPGSYRRYSIQKCKAVTQIPEWEMCE